MTDPYVRQKRLREIGDHGQLILSHASAMIPAGFAAEPTQEYLRRSGIGSITLGKESSFREFAHASYFQFEVCQNYAAGAWLATQLIVEILGEKLGSRNAKESL
jgi:hypothetical protein